MLRITTIDEVGQIVRLKVEGRLVGAWVTELNHACAVVLARQKSIDLDLSDVNFIDRQGIALLKRLAGERVHIIKTRRLVHALLGL